MFSTLRLRQARQSISSLRLKRCEPVQSALRTRLRSRFAITAGYLHASTSECYGEPLEHPQRESYWGNVNPVGPRSVYDEAKRYAEALVMAYHRSRGVNTHLVRIFNTYGPRLHPEDGRVISNFIAQALASEPLTIYGKGDQTRSFCYVDDLIEGILRLSRSDEHLPVNIGNPNEFTILECAREVLELTGSKSELRYLPMPRTTRRADARYSKAKTLLGWEPKIEFRQGLIKTIEYFAARQLEVRQSIQIRSSCRFTPSAERFRESCRHHLAAMHQAVPVLSTAVPAHAAPRRSGNSVRAVR